MSRAQILAVGRSPGAAGRAPLRLGTGARRSGVGQARTRACEPSSKSPRPFYQPRPPTARVLLQITSEMCSTGRRASSNPIPLLCKLPPNRPSKSSADGMTMNGLAMDISEGYFSPNEYDARRTSPRLPPPSSSIPPPVLASPSSSSCCHAPDRDINR